MAKQTLIVEFDVERGLVLDPAHMESVRAVLLRNLPHGPGSRVQDRPTELPSQALAKFKDDAQRMGRMILQVSSERAELAEPQTAVGGLLLFRDGTKIVLVFRRLPGETLEETARVALAKLGFPDSTLN